MINMNEQVLNRLDISHIFSPNWDKNNFKSIKKDNMYPCFICGKSVDTSKAHWVNKDCRTSEIVIGNPTDHYEYGLEPIGPDCWRKNKNILSPFEVIG